MSTCVNKATYIFKRAWSRVIIVNKLKKKLKKFHLAKFHKIIF